MWFQTTVILKEWEGRGGMTTRTTSGRFTGGATRKKDRKEGSRRLPMVGNPALFRVDHHVANGAAGTRRGSVDNRSPCASDRMLKPNQFGNFT